MKPWQFLLLLAVVPLFVAARDEDEPADAETVKGDYVAPPFVTPTVSGSPLLVDWFHDSSAIGKKWIKSSGKKDDVEDSIAKYNGEWEVGPPTKNVIDGDMALIVKTKARHHAIAAKFERPFRFDGKPLVVQYEVKYENGQECGGGYLKLLTVGAEQKLKEFTDKTPYTIMFGPDKCGPTSKVHFIVNIKNPKNGTVSEHHAKQPSKSLSSYFDDHRTHLYTLIVRPDESFTVLVDSTKIMSGSLLNDLEPSVTPPEMIDDPMDMKPSDWDEREKIDDPDAKKPDDWDEDAPKEIDDPSAMKPDDWLEDEEPLIEDPAATKPVDWDPEMDGEWEAPRIDNPKCKELSGCGKWKAPKIANPAYKGKWKAARIRNPNYKGKWFPKQIANPGYFEPHPYSQLQHIASVGFELWTMSENIVIDNIYIGVDEDAAKDFAKQTFAIKNAQESLFDTATSPSQGFFSQLISATEERPWLWVVYVLCLLIPTIVIGVACFGRKSRPSTLGYKKTDEPQPDDEEVPDLVGDDEEQPEQQPVDKEPEVEPVEKKQRTPSNSPSRSRRTPSNSPSRVQKTDLEKDNESQEGSDAGEEEEEEVDKPKVEQSSPKGKRVRQRRQD